MNDVFFAQNHIFPQRPLFPGPVFTFCFAVPHTEKICILYNRFVGPEESLPFLDLHISAADAQGIQAFSQSA